MQGIIDFLRTDNFLLMLSIMVGILTIGFISILYSNIKLKNKYNKFMKKIATAKLKSLPVSLNALYLTIPTF